MSDELLNPLQKLNYHQARKLLGATAELTLLMDDNEKYIIQYRKTISVSWDENEKPVYNYRFYRQQLDDLTLQQIFRALLSIKEYGSTQ